MMKETTSKEQSKTHRNGKTNSSKHLRKGEKQLKTHRGDPKTDHLKTGIIQKTDSLKSGF